MQDFAPQGAAPAQPCAPGPDHALACADQVFGILGERRFTHLSRRQAGAYRKATVASLQVDVRAGRALQFCWDLGPGYHASLRADFGGLRFDPGLGELLALRQISLFDRAVRCIYPPGVRFVLFIDDLCAWLVNDVPLVFTYGYIKRLEALVSALAMDGCACVQAESALLDAHDLRRAMALEPLPPDVQSLAWQPDGAEVMNVSRFVGHTCSVSEARQRVRSYLQAQAVSARWLSDRLPGVRLTQRASAATFGFRSFPGADARQQCGEVDLLFDAVGRPRPYLFTRNQRERYRRWPIAGGDLPACWPLPPGVAHALWPLEPAVDSRGTDGWD